MEAAVATGAFSLADLDNLPRDKRRVFKTHAPPRSLPVAGVGAAGVGAVRIGAAGDQPERVGAYGAGGADTVVAADAPPPGVRVIVVVRDPRDVAVSLYYHSRAIKVHHTTCSSIIVAL